MRQENIFEDNKNNIRAKKSLGQNFLHSRRVVERMAEVAVVGAGDVVLEIGPGKGILTEALLKKSQKVIAIEKDSRLISFLNEKFNEEIKNGKLRIVEADILSFDLKKLKLENGKYKVVANIPYYITGAVIEFFLSNKIQPSSMTLMVQKEVAERIVRSKKESILSISVKVYGQPKFVTKISRSFFNPMPKVDSAILHIDQISRKNFKNISEGRFFEVLKTGFHHKRKILRSNLKNIVSEEKYDECKIPEKARAEDLSLEDWICLTKNSK